jgi:hypothetical protein
MNSGRGVPAARSRRTSTTTFIITRKLIKTAVAEKQTTSQIKNTDIFQLLSYAGPSALTSIFRFGAVNPRDAEPQTRDSSRNNEKADRNEEAAMMIHSEKRAD